MKSILIALKIKNTKEMPIGGTEKRALATHNYFNSIGVNSTFLSYTCLSELSANLKSIKPEIVYNFGPSLPKEFITDFKKLNIRFAQTVNFFDEYRNYHDYNFVISKFEILKLYLHNPLDTRKLFLLYNPIDIELFSKKPKYLLYKKKNNELVIGRLARAEPSKWGSKIPLFMIWASLFLKRKSNRKITFIFVGLPLLYKLLLLPSILLLKSKNISIITYKEITKTNELPQFYHSIDLFWQTSKIGESFGNVIAEAFAAGKPVITDAKYFYKENKLKTYLYDSQLELVDDGKTGFYNNFPSTFFEVIENISDADILRMGILAKQKAKQFEKSIIFSGLEKILSSKETKVPDYNGIKKEYTTRINTALKTDQKSSPIEKITYSLFDPALKFMDLFYVFARKLILNLTKKNIEKVNFELR